jgi:glycosyltransferase involved in cell wall biosynthesis
MTSSLLLQGSDRQPLQLVSWPSRHLNIICSTLTRGGAERIVADLCDSYVRHALPITVTLYLMGDAPCEYPLTSRGNLNVVRLGHLPRPERIRYLVNGILISSQPVAITHLVGLSILGELNRAGILTIPVVHNGEAAWRTHPSEYHRSWIPLAVAVSSEVKRQLMLVEPQLRVQVIRHELPTWRYTEASALDRRTIRCQHNIREAAFLVGMVGNFRPQKRYLLALQVFELLCPELPIELMIIGGGQTGTHFVPHIKEVALQLEGSPYSDRLHLIGMVDTVEPYYHAFDAFLNTSLVEGLSIATLEAVSSGCPIVAADVGGQREILQTSDYLIPHDAGPESYARALQEIAQRNLNRTAAVPHDIPELIPLLWSWIAQHGYDQRTGRGPASVLFVTNNLNPGGAQRSLVNLLTSFSDNTNVHLAILFALSVSDFFVTLSQSENIRTVSLSQSHDTVRKVDELLTYIERARIATICFWNCDPRIKVLLAKVLAERHEVSIVDVSPGPMLFRELLRCEEFAKRVGFSLSEYLHGIDKFVTKYDGGSRFGDLAVPECKVVVIKNGVREVPSDEELLPDDLGVAFSPAAIACCRITPSKKIEELLLAASIVRESIPSFILTIVGGVEPKAKRYWETVSALHESLNLIGVVTFVGQRSDITPLLRSHALFVMLSTDQGCPNASLEAMAAGIPVIANDDGGTKEQVINGYTGILLNSCDYHELAEAMIYLLSRPDTCAKLGRNARDYALREFSMEQMVARYKAVLRMGTD